MTNINKFGSICAYLRGNLYMKKIEVASFINKMDDETLNSLLKGVENGTTRVFVGDSD